jgi:molecular chaperone GrpE
LSSKKDPTKIKAQTVENEAAQPEVMTAEEVAAEAAEKQAAATSEGEANEADSDTAASDAEPVMTAEEAALKLAAEYEELLKAKEESDNQRLRLQADFDNFRKRTRTEKEQWRNQIIGEVMSELLPVLDNFHWAIAAISQTDAESPHLPGIRMIENQLLALLSAKGVEKIDTAGADFDPQLHEAIGQVTVEDEAAVGKIFDEVQAGYKLGDKVLRPAKVRTACAKPEA